MCRNRCGRKFLAIVRSNLLLILTICGVILGFSIGFGLRTHNPDANTLMWIGVPGEIFLRLLRMMIIPLIVSGIIAGAAQSDPKTNGKISLIAVTWVLVVNSIGSGLGVSLALAIRPGVGTNSSSTTRNDIELLQTQDIFLDLIKNIFPDNIVNACIRKVQTRYVISKNGDDRMDPNDTTVKLVRQVGHADGTNILGLVFFSLMLGIAAGMAKEKGKPIVDFFSTLSDLVVRIMNWFMWYTPIGVASLIAQATADLADLDNVIQMLAYFLATVVAALGIYYFVLQLAYVVFLRKSPVEYHFALSKGLLTAFATTSSAVAISEIYKALDKYGMKKSFTRITWPFFLTMGSAGSATFVAASAVFIGQLANIPLTPLGSFVIWLLSATGIMAAPSIPSASIVVVMMILGAVGIPTESIGLLFTLEWILDRLRTTTNTLSHSYGTAITGKLCGVQRLTIPVVTQGEEDKDPLTVTENNVVRV